MTWNKIIVPIKLCLAVFSDRLIILHSFGGCVISGFEVIEEGSSSIPRVGSVGRKMPGLNRVNRAYKILSNLLNLLKDSVNYDNTSNSWNCSLPPLCMFRSTHREEFQKWLDIAPSNILTVTNCFFGLLLTSVAKFYPLPKASYSQDFYQEGISPARNVSFFPFLPAHKRGIKMSLVTHWSVENISRLHFTPNESKVARP